MSHADSLLVWSSLFCLAEGDDRVPLRVAPELWWPLPATAEGSFWVAGRGAGDLIAVTPRFSIVTVTGSAPAAESTAAFAAAPGVSVRNSGSPLTEIPGVANTLTT